MRVDFLARDPCFAAWPQLHCPTPFQAPEWGIAWWETFRPGPICSPAIIEGGEVVGLLPCYRSRLGTLRLLGTGLSDRLGPIGAPTRHGELLALAGDLGCDLHQLAPGSGGKPQQSTWSLALPSSFDEYLARFDRKRRYKARRLLGSRATVLDLPAGEGLPVLFDLHARRWRRRGWVGAFASRRVREFHVRHAQTSPGARVLLLKMDSIPVAAMLMFIRGGTWSFYQSGFDPSYSAASPGTRLLLEAIRLSIAQGAHTFDFLRGSESYKARWGATEQAPNERLIRAGQTLTGLAAASVNRCAVAIETFGRRALTKQTGASSG